MKFFGNQVKKNMHTFLEDKSVDFTPTKNKVDGEGWWKKL